MTIAASLVLRRLRPCYVARFPRLPPNIQPAYRSLSSLADIVKEIEEKEGEVMAFKKRTARPLSFSSDFVIYKSDVNIHELAATASFKCKAGAGLATIGFAGILAAMSTTASSPMIAALAMGAVANTYVMTVMTRRVLRQIVIRHVESVTFLASGEASETGGPTEEVKSEHERIIGEAATSDQRLESTPELRLHIRSGSINRWLTIKDEVQETRRLWSAEMNQEDGVSFGDFCQKLCLLHIDPDTGTTSDRAMLEALITSQKIIAEEQVELRSDVAAELLVPPEMISVPGVMLTGVKSDEVENTAKAVDARPPAVILEGIGRRGMFGGASVLGASFLFIAGVGARDSDGRSRWQNLTFDRMFK